MYLSTEILILKTIKYGETSLIVHAFSAHKGKVSFIVKGARKPKSKLPANLLQPLNILEVKYLHKNNKDLHPLYEAKLQSVYSTLLTDMRKTSIAIYLLEVVNRCLVKDEEHPDMYAFITHFLRVLDESLDYVNYHIYFLVELTKFFGFYPINNFSEDNMYFDMQLGVFSERKQLSSMSMETSEAFSRVLVQTLNNIGELRLDKALRIKMLGEIETFYQVHVPNFGNLNALEVYKMVFA